MLSNKFGVEKIYINETSKIEENEVTKIYQVHVEFELGDDEIICETRYENYAKLIQNYFKDLWGNKKCGCTEYIF